MLFSLGRTEAERRLLVNSTGRKWEFTFTTLVTFGGAFFASFPLFYSTSFGGAYWVWMIILFSFVAQAVSYEFQNKSPYFTITIFPVHNNHYDIVGDSTSKESLSLKYFFTKSQALQLCSFLEQKITSETMDIVNADEY